MGNDGTSLQALPGRPATVDVSAPRVVAAAVAQPSAASARLAEQRRQLEAERARIVAAPLGKAELLQRVIEQIDRARAWWMGPRAADCAPPVAGLSPGDCALCALNRNWLIATFSQFLDARSFEGAGLDRQTRERAVADIDRRLAELQVHEQRVAVLDVTTDRERRLDG